MHFYQPSFMLSADKSDNGGVLNNQGHVLKVPGLMFFICVLESHSNVTCLRGDFGRSCPFINVFSVATSLVISRHARSPSLVRHIYHCPIIIVIHCEDWLLPQPIHMSKTFSCLFLLSFMLTLPLHEVMIPLFFFSFSHLIFIFIFLQMDPALLFILFFSILSHLPFSLFYFC